MSINRKPSYEKITPEIGSSFSVKQYLNPSSNSSSPFWHFHPEVELVYVKGGSGSRHVGNHLSLYQDGDLILVGSMLPHSGFTDRLTGNESETIIHFNMEFLGSQFFDIIEMADIRNLLQRAKVGISFYGDAKNSIGARIEKLATLFNYGKLIELLCILQDLAWTDEYMLLNADGYVFDATDVNQERINTIYDFVKKEFKRQIPLSEIASLSNMTVPAFCRYFKKISNKTFTQFVNEFRIVYACKLLVEQPISITDICYEAGFNNFSHFNRQFKEATGQSPSAYRKTSKQFRVTSSSPA